MKRNPGIELMRSVLMLLGMSVPVLVDARAS